MTGKIGGVFVELKANVDASGIVKGEQKIVSSAKKIQNEFKKTSSAAANSSRKMVKANKATTKSMGGMGRKAGAASIQLQQFTGQVSGGVNPLIAFSQQAADLGIVMGAPLIGSIVGIAAAIGVVLLPELFKASETTEELVDKIKSLEEATKRTAAQNRVLANSNNEEVKSLSKRNQKLSDLIKKEQDLQDVRESAGTGTDKGQFAVPRSAIENQLRYAKTIDESRKKLDGYRGELDTNNQSIIALSKNTAELNDQTSETTKSLQQQIAITAAELEGGQDAARRLSLALKLGHENASLLPQELKDSLTKLELMEAKAKKMAESDRTEALKTSKFKAAILADEAKRKTDRGSNLDRLRQDIMTEQELLKTKSEDEIILLDASLLAGEVLRDEFDEIRKAKAQELADALLVIAKKSADAETRLEENKQRAKFAAVSNAFGNLSSLMNTESKKMFEIGKAAALAGAIVDGIAAVQGAYKVGNKIGGPPLGAAFGAAAAVQAAVQVQQIAKQKIGGAAGGSSSFSGGLPAANTTQQAAPQTQNVDVRVTASGGGIVDMFNFEVANGANPIMS
jgi:hypothetical protein